MACVLIVEDEEILAKNIRRTLEKVGHSVSVAATCADGERMFGELRPDLMLLDLRLPDGSGLDLLARLKGRDAACPILMMTAHATIEDAVRAITWENASRLYRHPVPEAVQRDPNAF